MLFVSVEPVLFVSARYDAWLPKGLATYLCSMYRRKAFGVNDYRYKIAQVNKPNCFCVLDVSCLLCDESHSFVTQYLYFMSARCLKNVLSLFVNGTDKLLSFKFNIWYISLVMFNLQRCDS